MSPNSTPHDFPDEGFEDELAPGTMLLHGQYVIEKFLNNGGFGITYLAKDSLHRRVVIKECFPETLCGRSKAIVRVRSRDKAETFRTIVDLFIEEARNLARLSHPNIVGVHQVFEDNETAYMAMDFVEGGDLMAFAEGSATIDPAELERILVKLLGAVEFMHAGGILHRDISPDNILLSKDGEPVLIDFGAARETVSHQHSYLASLRTVKDGYSPQEFYVNTSAQHPSSDLYSLAASLYQVMCQKLPVGAQRRMTAIASGEDDPYIPIGNRVTGFTEPFLDAIDLALKVFPKDRLQSAAEWKARLARANPGEAVSRPMLAVENGNILEQFARGALEKARSRTSAPKTPNSRPEAAANPTRDPKAVAAPSGAASTSGLHMGGAAAALLVFIGAGAFLWLGGKDTAAPNTVAAPGAPRTDEAAASPPPPSTGLVRDVSKRPEQVPFFLAGSSDGDVTVSSASGTLSARSNTAAYEGSLPTPEAAPAGDPASGDGATAGQSETEDIVAEGPEPAAPGAQEASAVISAKVLRFPVEGDSADPAIVASANGSIADRIAPGLRIVSINGFPIEDLSDFQRVIDATTEYAVGDEVSVAFGVEDTITGARDVRIVDLPAVRRTMLLNGVVFETMLVGGTWVTEVAHGSGEQPSDLRAGDRVVALMPSNERIEGADAMAELLRRELKAGATQFNFAVSRDGEMWLAEMRYAAGPAD